MIKTKAFKSDLSNHCQMLYIQAISFVDFILIYHQISSQEKMTHHCSVQMSFSVQLMGRSRNPQTDTQIYEMIPAKSTDR